MTSSAMKCAATFGVAVAIGFGLTASPTAQRRRGGADANAGVPIATNMILTNPSAYAGKVVTISARIVDVVSPTAFVLDQHRMVSAGEVSPLGARLLVIAPYLAAPPDQKNYLLVKGQVATLDRAQIPAGYALPPDVAAKFHGKPALLATSILTSTYTELVLKPVAPPGPEELALMAAMKIVGPASATLRAAAQESKKDAVLESSAKLIPAFTQTERVWEDLGQTAPAQWARDAKDLLAVIERETQAANWDAVKLSAGNLQQTCATCHGAYRERQEDGTFRIKPGSY